MSSMHGTTNSPTIVITPAIPHPGPPSGPPPKAAPVHPQEPHSQAPGKAVAETSGGKSPSAPPPPSGPKDHKVNLTA